MTEEIITAPAAPELSNVEPSQVTEPSGITEAPVAEPLVEQPAVDESVTDETVDEVVEKPPKHKQTYQERMNELTYKRREAERQAAYWKAQVEQSTTAAVPITDEPPKADDFATVEEFVDSHYKWRRAKELRETQTATVQQLENQALEQFNDRSSELRAAKPDFDEVVNAPVFTPTMRAVVLNSDKGPEMAYYLGSKGNRQFADRIRNMTPLQQAIELGKLESRFVETKTNAKKTTGAPPPIAPVGSTAVPIPKDSEMSTEAWYEKAERERLEKIKAHYGR